MSSKQSDALVRVMDLVRHLRTHCPWDAAQTPRSLIPYLLEEAHESADAIADGDDRALRSELGDLLLNVAFQLVLGEERDAFGPDEVADTVIDKMQRRHPHLYGLGEKEEWETLKAKERDEDLRVEIIEFYQGARYAAYTFKRYEHIYLVAAPEEDVAYFGGDADNFTYPRYALDFAFFRAYDDAGDPLRSEHYFPWHEQGSEAGQPVFVVGNPGATSRLLPIDQLVFQRDYALPQELSVLETRADILGDFVEANPELAEEYDLRNALFSVRNSMKATRGQLEGLRDHYLMARRAAAERDLREAIMQNDSLRERYGDLFEEIDRLKEEKNAVLLAHYYQEPDIQDIADYIGDSLGLARKAADTDADIIVFAGVHFMAETAKILNPTKKVLLPDLNAGCSLADSCPPEEFAVFKAEHPDHVVVSYINCSAGVKALSDVICTSGNAEKIVNQVPKDRTILFVPDQNLGQWVMRETGRDMLLWEGSCEVHELFSEDKIVALQQEHPDHIIVDATELPGTDSLEDTLIRLTRLNDCPLFSNDTKLVAQMQPYHEAKSRGQYTLRDRAIPSCVTQIADGENGGVMMNEFPRDFHPVWYDIKDNGRSTAGVVGLNGTEYIELLEASGVDPNDYPTCQAAQQHKIWQRVDPDQATPDAVQQTIQDLEANDDQFHTEGASWTNDLSWVQGYENVLGPMTQLSALFHQTYDRTVQENPVVTQSREYQEALLYVLLLETSCFRYWGQGRWTDYAQELYRRGEAVMKQ